MVTDLRLDMLVEKEFLSMGKKRPEDEIQQKLVELELSIKDDQVKQTPSTVHASTQLSAPGKKAKNQDKNLAETVSAMPVKLDADSQATVDMYQFGGIALMGVSGVLLMSHIGISLNLAAMWGRGFGASFLLIPLFVGVGMLFYNYKSKIARYVTLGSLAAMFVMMLMQLTFTFWGLSLLDFILMVLPLCAGASLLVKAHVKRGEFQEGTKLIK